MPSSILEASEEWASPIPARAEDMAGLRPCMITGIDDGISAFNGRGCSEDGAIEGDLGI